MKKIIVLVMAAMTMVSIASCKGNTTTETSDTSTTEIITTTMPTTELQFRINGRLKPVNSYAKLEEEFIQTLFTKGNTAYAIFDASELTTEILENRTPEVIIVERCISIITNEHKDGDARMLNYLEGNGYYIKHAEGYEDGTIMLTYFIYNANTQYYDDIVERYDFVLDTEYVD
jgi:hypothetical protein